MISGIRAASDSARRAMTVAVLGLLVAGLLAGVPASAATPTATTPTATTTTAAVSNQAFAQGAAAAARKAPNRAKYQRQAFKATNNQRANRGRVKLKKQKCLQRFANRHAKRMAREQRMFHQPLGPILKQCKLRIVGENVAYGYPNGRATVNRGWMRSTMGHRENLLRKEYRRMAIGARRGSDGRWYASQVLGR